VVLELAQVTLLNPKYLEDEILNGLNDYNWLVVFYPDPRKSDTVYTALRIAELARAVNCKWLFNHDISQMTLERYRALMREREQNCLMGFLNWFFL
jgi:hypothetical protein